MQLTLIETRQEAPEAISFFFEPDQPMTWDAGQFLQYTLPHLAADNRGSNRYFSIASAPSEGHVRLTTRFAENSSTFKATLKAMRPGQTIGIGKPEGDFVITDPTEEFVFVAGGAGITAFRAMLMDLDHKEFPMHIALLYANRDEHFIYRDELDALARKHKNFTIRYVVSPEKIDAANIRAAAPQIARPTFYVSGPEPMVEALDRLLPTLGVPPSHLRNDYLPGYAWP